MRIEIISFEELKTRHIISWKNPRYLITKIKVMIHMTIQMTTARGVEKDGNLINDIKEKRDENHLTVEEADDGTVINMADVMTVRKVEMEVIVVRTVVVMTGGGNEGTGNINHLIEQQMVIIIGKWRGNLVKHSCKSNVGAVADSKI